jgi:hypothetical protein
VTPAGTLKPTNVNAKSNRRARVGWIDGSITRSPGAKSEALARRRKAGRDGEAEGTWLLSDAPRPRPRF